MAVEGKRTTVVPTPLASGATYTRLRPGRCWRGQFGRGCNVVVTRDGALRDVFGCNKSLGSLSIEGTWTQSRAKCNESSLLLS